MNGHIKKLVKRAGGHFDTHCLASNPVQYRESIQMWDEHIEKFAKLIAQECMDIIVQNRKYASEHNWPAVELANVCLYEIDKTFEVQENGKETVSS